MKAIDFKKVLPYFIAIIIFVALSFAYYSPVIDGYSLNQHDISQFKGMSKEISDHRLREGEEPLWTNSMFSGMPAAQISVAYSDNLMGKVYRLMRLGLPHPVYMLFLLMLGFFILMCVLKSDIWISIAGAVAFGFSSYFVVITMAGHNSKAIAIAFLAPLLASIIMSYRGKLLIGGALTALFFALELNANHVQITYYFFMFVLMYGIVEFYNHVKTGKTIGFLKRTGVLALALLLGLGCNIASIWGTYEYGKYSTRGKTELTINERNESNKSDVTSGLDRSYIYDYSSGKAESFTFLFPNAKGGASQERIADNNRETLKKSDVRFRQNIGNMPQYWGDQRIVSGPNYGGAIIALLFVLGLVFVKDRIKWAILTTVILTIMLSWGGNFRWFSDLFVDHVPGYNKFRAPTIILSVTALALPLLAMLGLKQIVEDKENIVKKMNLFYIGSTALIAILGLFYLLPDTFFSFMDLRLASQFADMLKESPEQTAQVMEYQNSIINVRIGIFQKDVLRSLAFMVIATALIWTFLTDKINSKVLVSVIGVLILVDLWGVDRRYLNNEKVNGKYKQWVKKSKKEIPFDTYPSDQSILKGEFKEFPDLKSKAEKGIAEKRKATKRPVVKAKEDAIKFSILNSNTDYRVFEVGNPFNSARTSFYHKSIGGYHGAKLKRYQDLVSFYLARDNYVFQQVQQQISTASKQDDASSLYMISSQMNQLVDQELRKMNVLNMLNTKYIVLNPGSYNQFSDLKPATTPLLASPGVKNPYALGNAWFVKEIEMVNNPDEEILALKEFDPKSTAIVDKKFSNQLQGFTPPSSTGTIVLVDYKANYLVYKSNSSEDQLAVFSEVYLPVGWKAFVDGKVTSHLRANYILRALKIPAGEHKIEFKYEPKSFDIGTRVALISSILIIIALLEVAYLQLKPLFLRNKK